MKETVAIKTKDHFLSHFGESDFSFDADFAKEKRDKALKAIENLEFPTSKTEYWRFTRINRIIRGNYKFDYPNEKLALDLSITAKNCIVLINGYYSERLSSFKLKDGVYFSALSKAKEDEQCTVIRKRFASRSKDDEQIFAAINTAYHQDGAFLHLQKNTIVEEPIYIVHIVDSEAALSNPRNLIVIEEGSQAKVVMKTISTNKGASFTNMLTEIFVDKSAHLELNKIQQEGKDDFQIANEEVWQEANSTFKINTFTLEGALVRNNLNIDLMGQHTETWLNGLYLLEGKQHVDNHTRVFHREPNCVSHELYKGIIDDKGSAVFNGRVLVHREAQKTNAYQSNANMLLTDDAKINAKPELEIYADDVKCSHGSTIGQLDEEALFYLRSRGIPEKIARSILLNAFASDVLQHVGIESLREELKVYIDDHYQGVK